MQSFQYIKHEISGPLVKSSPFSPFLANTLKGPNNDYEWISYCQKQNMIIARNSDDTMNFYDATTLMPLEKNKLDGFVADMSCDHENETFLIGRKFGSIYVYNASSDELKQLRKSEDFVTAIAFLDYPFYAFSFYESRGLYVGTFDRENVSKFELQSNNAISLCSLLERKILLAGSDNGSLRIYRTDHLPHLLVFYSIQAHTPRISEIKVQKMRINGKEYVITSSRVDRMVKIWHLIKGRMRLLRVIHTEGVIDSFVYLENYKMVAIACQRPNGICFFKVFSGKLENKFANNNNKEPIIGLFLMKEKNMIGGLGGVSGVHCDSCDSIKLIQLHQKKQHPKEKPKSAFELFSRKIDKIKKFFKKL